MNSKFLFLSRILAFLMTSISVMAQDNISVPSTPAFSILNYEPASIMRPSNPKDLSADILNSLSRDGKLLMNLGIEVAPYWLKSRPQLTRDAYDSATGKQLFFQSLSLSAATVKDSTSGNNKIGTGFRFRLLGGRTTPEYQEKKVQLIKRATFVSVVTGVLGFADQFPTQDSAIHFIENLMRQEKFSQEYIDEFLDHSNNLKESGSQQDIRGFIQKLATEIASLNESFALDVITSSRKRLGFVVEVAGAASFITTTKDEFEKAGIWINAANVVSTTDAFNLSARVFFTGKDSSNTNLDLGLSYIKELTNFSVSIEAMGRFYRSEFPDFNLNGDRITRVDRDFTYRLAAQAAYRISENISVNLSLGKDFNAPFLQRSGFFSILGVNYSIFKKDKP